MQKERKDIDPKYKWDLSVIYNSDEAFEADYKEVENAIRAFASHEGTMNTSAEALYRAFCEKVAVGERLSRLWHYAFLHFAVDATDSHAQAMQTRVLHLYDLLSETAWFMTPKMLSLDEEKVEAWMKEYPPLCEFRRKIHSYMRFRPHALSEEGEKLYAQLGEALGTHSNIYQLLTASDITLGAIRDENGKKKELTAATYAIYVKSKDRRVRRAAFRTVYKTYEQFSNTLAALYEARVKEKHVLSKVRGYPDSITAATFGEEVTPQICENLIETVHKSLPVAYDYFALKREILGLPVLHLYDVYAPLIANYDKKYSYEEAVDEVLRSVAVFGEEYVKTLKEGLLSRRWADVYPSRGKRSGAFSANGCEDVDPFILMNFNERFGDISTLAHEAGHSMHTWYSKRANPPQDSHPTIFVAEVASTVNELLLAHRRLRESQSDEEKLYILNELMETYKGTIIRQTMFAEFERDMHAAKERGEPLTAEFICRHYYDLNRLYFGDGVFCDKEISYEWTRIHHFYSCFYVYKYATCLSAASAIVRRIEEEGEAYVGKYIDFLKCGSAKSPLESLLVAEIDMTKPEVIESAMRDFADIIAQFRALYQKNMK